LSCTVQVANHRKAIGLLYAGVQTAANAGVPKDQAGLAAALITASFQLGSALGLAVFTGIATSRTSHLLAARTPPPEALTAGFQRAFAGPVASAAWILARAAGHLEALTASVLFGKGVYALTRPGEKPAQVTDFRAIASTESASRALDGALGLASPGTARLLVIVSDAMFVAPGEPAGVQQRITRLHRAGCGVIILTPKGCAAICKYTDCQVTEAASPAGAIDAIARAATRALAA
jgi:hypothetical protein